MLADRRDELARERAKAMATLARWLGDEASLPLAGGPPALKVEPAALQGSVEQQADLRVFDPMLRMTNAEVQEMEAAKKGDWNWEFMYSKRGSAYGDMVSFQFTFELPFWAEQRQDPQVAAKQKEAERIGAERDDLARRRREDIGLQLAELDELARKLERLRASLRTAGERTRRAVDGGLRGCARRPRRSAGRSSRARRTRTAGNRTRGAAVRTARQAELPDGGATLMKAQSTSAQTPDAQRRDVGADECDIQAGHGRCGGRRAGGRGRGRRLRRGPLAHADRHRWRAAAAPVSTAASAGASGADGRKVLYWYDPMKPEAALRQARQVALHGHAARAASTPTRRADAAACRSIRALAQKPRRCAWRRSRRATLVQRRSRPSARVALQRARRGDRAVARRGFVERVYARAPGDVVARRRAAGRRAACPNGLARSRSSSPCAPPATPRSRAASRQRLRAARHARGADRARSSASGQPRQLHDDHRADRRRDQRADGARRACRSRPA